MDMRRRRGTCKGASGKKQPKAPFPFFALPVPLLLLIVLAGLVGNAAAGLAGGLTGGLALAAAAVPGALAQAAGLQRLDSFHGFFLHFVGFPDLGLYHNKPEKSR